MKVIVYRRIVEILSKIKLIYYHQNNEPIKFDFFVYITIDQCAIQ